MSSYSVIFSLTPLVHLVWSDRVSRVSPDHSSLTHASGVPCLVCRLGGAYLLRKSAGNVLMDPHQTQTGVFCFVHTCVLVQDCTGSVWMVHHDIHTGVFCCFDVCICVHVPTGRVWMIFLPYPGRNVLLPLCMYSSAYAKVKCLCLQWGAYANGKCLCDSLPRLGRYFLHHDQDKMRQSQDFDFIFVVRQSRKGLERSGFQLRLDAVFGGVLPVHNHPFDSRAGIQAGES